VQERVHLIEPEESVEAHGNRPDRTVIGPDALSLEKTVGGGNGFVSPRVAIRDNEHLEFPRKFGTIGERGSYDVSRSVLLPV